ncbi:MAG: ABC transporter permease [Bacillota bacterium]|nr:ABC transporter permease [Bacillota bacterium]
MKIAYYLKLAWRSLFKNKRIYFPYLICGSLIVGMFYILFMLNKVQEYAEHYYGARTTGAILGFSLFVFGLLSLFILFLMNTTVIKSRMREFGLYSVLGMNKRNIISLLFAEINLMTLIILTTGILLGILFSQLSYLILVRLVGLPIALNFVVPVEAIWETVAVFAFGFGLVFVYDMILILRSKTVDMVYGNRRGEKEPKVNLLYLLIGIAALSYGYIGAQTAPTALHAIALFLPLVLAVIVGTYSLFVAASILVLKLLKKRNSYYKPVPFITISGMLFRMKKNAVGLASICILSTCALVTLSATSGLFAGAEHALKEHLFGDFKISQLTRDLDNHSINHDADIVHFAQQDLERYGLRTKQVKTFRSVVSPFRFDETARVARSLEEENYGKENDARNLASISDLDAWNNLYDPLAPLAKDEVYIARAKDDAHPHVDSVELFGKTYRVASEIDSPVSNIWEAYFIIMPDALRFQEIGALTSQPPITTYGFSLEAIDSSQNTEQLIRRFSVDLRNRYVDTVPRMLECTTITTLRDDFRGTFGTLMFLGVFFSILFVIAASTIMYYKQISEGIDDRTRFRIMHQVGMENELVNRTIRRQILWIFLLPLGVATLHVAFSFRIITQILQLFGVVHIPTILNSFLISVSVFTAFYLLIYLLTARVYKRMLRA